MSKLKNHSLASPLAVEVARIAAALAIKLIIIGPISRKTKTKKDKAKHIIMKK